MNFFVDEDINPNVLKKSFVILIQHHEQLRATFHANQLGWHQKITPISNVKKCLHYTYYDFSEISQDQFSSAKDEAIQKNTRINEINWTADCCSANLSWA